MKRVLRYLFLTATLVAAPLSAQEDSDDDAGGPLVRLLENTLSGDNRQIQVVGLEGALSARATIEKIVVSDDEGPWLTLSDAVLDWNRLALVRGRFSVNELSASELIIERQPAPTETTELPSPEATPFAVPELPVSIEIGQFSIDRIELGEELAGQSAELTVNGNLILADGALDTGLTVDRLDQPADRISLSASFSNETRQLGLDLTAEEAAGGLVSNILGIPDAPPLRLTAVGAGPLDAFGADIALATDGQNRVTGRVELKGETDADGNSTALAFDATLGGDVTVLMDPAYHDFFGSRTDLVLSGRQFTDGQIIVETLDVNSESLQLEGALDLSADRTAAKVDLNGRIAPPGGSSVALPIGEPQTSIASADIALSLDTETSDQWSLDVNVEGLSRSNLALDQATASAGGSIDLSDGLKMTGALDLSLTGLAPTDRALRDATGDALTLTGDFALPGDGTLSLSQMVLGGDGYDVSLGATIQGLNSGFFLTGSAELSLPDLTQFSGLANRPLSGSLLAGVTGSGAPLGGSFDFVLTGTANDLSAGIAQLDPLLTGETRLSVDAGRDASGLVLRDLTLSGTALSAQASGAVKTGDIELELTAALDDLGRILPDIPGPVQVNGKVNQKGDNLNADLDVDAPGGAMAQLAADIEDMGEGNIALNLSVSEPANGPISALLKLPGQPALDLTVEGTGPLDRFDASIALATDGADRLKGDVSLTQSEDPVSMQISADLGGDLTPLLPQDFHEFVGTDSDLELSMVRDADGRIELDRILLSAQALMLNGSATVTAEGLPESVDLAGRITPPTGDSVQLPIPGGTTTIGAATVNATLDGTQNDAWRLSLDVDDLTREEGTIERVSILGDGTISVDGPLMVSGALEAGLSGVALQDAKLQDAIGARARVTTQFDLPGDGTLTVSDLRLSAGELFLTGSADVSGLDETPKAQASARFSAPDIARFSGLAGQSLAGALSAQVSGSFDTGGQDFEVDLSATGRSLSTGIAQADALLTGDTVISVQAKGNPDSVDIAQMSLKGDALSGDVAGTLGRTQTDLTISAALDELNRVVPQVQGPLTLKGTVGQDANDWIAKLRVDATQSFATLNAKLNPSGDADIGFDVEVASLERFLPDLTGKLTAQGEAMRSQGKWTAKADVQGPANVVASVDGGFDEASGDVSGTATGRVELAAVNHLIRPVSIEGPLEFDLSVAGQPGLDAVSGQITTSNVSIAIPQVQNTVSNFRGAVRLNQGQAAIELAGDVRTGGGFTVTGPVSLTAPFDGNVTLALQQIILTDELSYRSSLNGQVVYSGPLAGDGQIAGRIDVGETEFNVAAASGGAGAAPIPPITHLSESSGSYQTRLRAGLVDTGNGEGGRGPNIGLNVEISAPNRIYVRGYGLNAELGGNLFVRGSTQNIAPSGQIGLIRGTINVLGRNLDLSRGLVTMQGSLEPYMDFAATTTTQDGSATIEIVGEVDDLAINIFSDPERPEDEALAMLVFGQPPSELSPLRLAQMAVSLARLRSGGGDFLTDTAGEAGADRASLGADSSGIAALGIGGYVADNVYSDVSVNADGDAELNINLDVSENLTIKGSVNNEGETGLGLFFERNY